MPVPSLARVQPEARQGGYEDFNRNWVSNDLLRDGLNAGMVPFGGRWTDARYYPQVIKDIERRLKLNPFQSGSFRQQNQGEIANLEDVFSRDFQRGLGYVSPEFGSRYGRIMERNPFAVRSAYERRSMGRPGLGVVDFLEKDFDPENFAAGLSSFERGERPQSFMSRQRRLFR